MSCFLRVGGNKWEEAPGGEYPAKCTKIIPDFIGRKTALYFVNTEGEHAGKRARLFYNKLPRVEAEQLGTDFGAGSKLFSDLSKLYPELVGNGTESVELDFDKLFLDKTFLITTELRGKEKQATVQKIEHYIGF